MIRTLGVVLTMLAAATPLAAQSAGRIALTVRETAGIRRTQFPATARVPLPQGALRDAAHAHLLLGTTVVPSQPMADTRWPDGSVRELVVDFNASPEPNGSLAYTLEYGDTVQNESPARGLAVTEEADAIQIGTIRFSKSASPLIASVKYRDEAIGTGANGLVVVDRSGAAHDLSTAANVKVEIVKRGPLVAVLRYTGTLTLDQNATAPFTLLAEMPSSKSWVKLSAFVDDPSRRIKSLAIRTPLALGALPWVWDLGTARWTYGSFRNATDSAVLTHDSSGSTPRWTVVSGPKGREQPYESSPGPLGLFGGWGHIQGGKEVVAWAIDHAPEWTGTTRVALDGAGLAEFSLESAQPAVRHAIVVYEHFVSTPVQIGAATSPAAILSPLVVSVGP